MLTPAELPSLVEVLDKCTVCRGNPDDEYAELAYSRKGAFKDASGTKIKAKLDNTPSSVMTSSIRVLCGLVTEILVSGGSCSRCKEY